MPILGDPMKRSILSVNVVDFFFFLLFMSVRGYGLASIRLGLNVQGLSTPDVFCLSEPAKLSYTHLQLEHPGKIRDGLASDSVRCTASVCSEHG